MPRPFTSFLASSLSSPQLGNFNTVRTVTPMRSFAAPPPGAGNSFNGLGGNINPGLSNGGKLDNITDDLLDEHEKIMLGLDVDDAKEFIADNREHLEELEEEHRKQVEEQVKLEEEETTKKALERKKQELEAEKKKAEDAKEEAEAKKIKEQIQEIERLQARDKALREARSKLEAAEQSFEMEFDPDTGKYKRVDGEDSPYKGISQEKYDQLGSEEMRKIRESFGDLNGPLENLSNQFGTPEERRDRARLREQRINEAQNKDTKVSPPDNTKTGGDKAKQVMEGVQIEDEAPESSKVRIVINGIEIQSGEEED